MTSTSIATPRGLAGRLQALTRFIHQQPSRHFSGLLRAARPAVAAAIFDEAVGPSLYICAQPQDAADIAAELGTWCDRPVYLLPAIESLPYERVQADRDVLAQRQLVVQAVVGNESCVVVASARAFMQPLPPPADMRHELTVRRGDRVSMDSLLAGLVDIGYGAVPMVEDVGCFAHRGGLVDIFPAGADSPLRVEFFGSVVESIRRFDVASQRSIGEVDAVNIPPVAVLSDALREQAVAALLDVDTSELTRDAESEWLQDLARLEAGSALDEMPVFLPYMTDDLRNVADHMLPDATVVLDDPAQFDSIARELWDQAESVVAERQEAGLLPRNLRPALLAPDLVLSGLEKLQTVRFTPGSGSGNGTRDAAGVFASAPVFAGKLRDFVRYLSDNSHATHVVATLQHERTAEILREEGVLTHDWPGPEGDTPRGVTLVPVELHGGWSIPGENLTVFTDRELFGYTRPQPRKRRTRSARESFFIDYRPGDYVVHLEHGIGRFEGVTHMTVDGAEREYAIVQYAGADRLYVPSDQLERLTRYVGVGDTPPTLNKLGGADWQRTRQRAKQAAEDISRELVDIYSKRMAREGYGFSADAPWQHELESSFAYMETPDQLKAVDEVKADMEAPRPMDRLVCADVGYGKTEVAVRAAFKAVMDGRQVAVLAPTTILAQQHFETFSSRYQAFPVRVEALSRFRTPAQQRQILQQLATGEVDVVIGTHRLLSKDVKFRNLGLLIVDEEQRFGVKHKEQLKRLRETIDVLTLTATPIPRTLHMGLVGIREISVIETPPEGRLPIRTYLQPYEDRLVREAVLRELDRGGQVYVVHNKVASIQAMAERIRQLVPEARVLVGHGQMDEVQLERTMLAFAHQEGDVLVASTIIENGLDIPNVNTIIVNHAEALGLTQLYQLRGRVGRGANQAYAYLLYPRDARLSVDAMRRMEAVFEAQQLGAGFNIAMKDLEIRGAGNLLGAEQSGYATAVGFDLFTRMISDAVEAQRGVAVQEQPLVTVDIPLTMFLPDAYVASESQRLTLYRRIAALSNQEELESMRQELIDRFGPLPVEVDNLLTSVGIKLLAMAARVVLVSLSGDFLTMRIAPNGVYDRVSLYRTYGVDARISTNVLRLPRIRLPEEWVEAITAILRDMIRLRESIGQPAAAEVASKV